MAFEDKGFPIPQPPPRFALGNLDQIDSTNAPASMWRLADVYGDIFQLDLAGRHVIVCNTHELVDDLCDSNRFEKSVAGALKEVRALTKDGLFTAYPGERNWGIAHRLLMPVFGPMSIQKMFGGMMDIASQMLLQWDRFGPDHEIDCADNFTRLTFDMIGLCAFGFRFNNFYTENAHPFVTQMTDVLVDCGKRANRLSIENKLRIFSARQTSDNIAAMHVLCDEIIKDRKAHPQPETQDLLNAMLNSTDPETGEKMSDENIRYNMVTFLVAGHETTSGTLGFLFYHLLKNPEKYMAAQKEVDEVVGNCPLHIKHVSQLKYIKYSIFETLRYMGPIAFIAKHAKFPTKIAGKYLVEPTAQILSNLRPFHHDPRVWGSDADIFRPERWLNGGFESLPKNAFKAFGDGERACIGRGFAEQEMILVVALILQNFQVEMADPSYVLHPKVTLTIKPSGFRIKIRRRPGHNLENLGGAFTKQPQTSHDATPSLSTHNKSMNEGKPITILYGSQAGTCKAYAEELQSNAPHYGFAASVGTLDSATEHVPKDQPIIIIAPSYEGRPAYNAKQFVAFVESNVSNKIFQGVNYAVFSVGNSDWVNTFHRIPKLLDENFEKMGATRVTKTGYVDVKYDVMGPWEEWTETLWRDLQKISGTTTEVLGSKLQAAISSPTFASHIGGEEIGYGIVKVNKDLGGKEVGLAKKHMEVELPLGSSYRAGDYIVVLPTNPIANVKRVLKRFDITPDDDITISGTNKAFLSPGTSLSVFDLLMTRVELGTPASKKQIEALAEATPQDQRKRLSEMANDDLFKQEVLGKRFSVLDILEDNIDCRLPFSSYLDMLKPLSPRQYSVSSSPLANIQFVTDSAGIPMQKITASITYDIHEETALSGHGTFYGVASTYLARQEVGERVRCFTRPTNVNFHLPLDPMTPIIMVAAGSGLAPMRSFIQERAVIKGARNQALGPAILYYGCRSESKDFIYASELKAWESEGIVSVRPAFSRDGSVDGLKHVPDRMWNDRRELTALFREQGAKVFVCGSASKLGKSTADVCKKIYMEGTGTSEDEAEEWLMRAREERYVSDTFE